MSITEADIREAAQHRPYEELDDQSLSALLDAFESFIPNLKSFGLSVEDALKGEPGETAEILGKLRSVEPTVSLALFELLVEIAIRSKEQGHSYWDGFELWERRGLIYGFDAEAISTVLELRSQQS